MTENKRGIKEFANKWIVEPIKRNPTAVLMGGFIGVMTHLLNLGPDSVAIGVLAVVGTEKSIRTWDKWRAQRKSVTPSK